MASTSKFLCPLCSNVAHLTLDFKGLLKHLSLFHAHHPDFKVPCGIDGCLRQFTNLRTYQNHMSSVHNCCMGNESEALEQDSLRVIESSSDRNENNYTCDDIDTSNVEENDDADLNTSTETPACSKELLQKSSALFLLGLKEKYKLTQVSIQGIVDGVTSLTQQNMSFLQSQVCT